MPEDSWAYKDAGVDIEAGAAAVDVIKELVKKTSRPGVVGGIGGFGGLFRLEPDRYDDPLLVSSTDGVGTKVKIAQEAGVHDTIGIDLVAMCVNDIVVMGAEPLFFLDYIACGKLEVSLVTALVKGISDGCVEAGCALLGGETAEMPDMYKVGEYDLAGFTVGVVEKSKVIDGSAITDGDVIIGLPSSGIHSNGYSLVRKLLPEPDPALQKQLLTPTRIYVKQILELVRETTVHGIAHITGGGLVDNVARLLPEGTAAVLNTDAWKTPELFAMLQRQGNVKRTEMFTVFNMGIGMAIILPVQEAEKAGRLLQALGEEYFVIGQIAKGRGNVVLGGS
ncbi:MAG: phosphoribosylformylglycinamidine cyclo-ligase [Actinomycetota bacterium]